MSNNEIYLILKDNNINYLLFIENIINILKKDNFFKKICFTIISKSNEYLLFFLKKLYELSEKYSFPFLINLRTEMNTNQNINKLLINYITSALDVNKFFIIKKVTFIFNGHNYYIFNYYESMIYKGYSNIARLSANKKEDFEKLFIKIKKDSMAINHAHDIIIYNKNDNIYLINKYLNIDEKYENINLDNLINNLKNIEL